MASRRMQRKELQVVALFGRGPGYLLEWKFAYDLKPGPCFWLLFCHDNLVANNSSLGSPAGRVFGMPLILM
ncbi:hypothetical protein Nepgr_033648 [Nepenthes gracilis]|uniref:Uncharacterized protein n=1 Tax=Nepenthes gracilis TaxID=150966 RepID=A0AAD3TMF6_NEPGR|nr:hypothetical protein Nepgr_033648 [Nepenthes gracilis]